MDEEGHLRLQRNIELLNVFLANCFGEGNHLSEDRTGRQ
jgi:hypothetical protein